MPDREKVIKELTCCIYSEEEYECPEDCPYADDDMSECQAKVMRDALALLKEQETVEHALEVLRKAGWKETQDVPFPAELLKEQEHGETLEVIREQKKQIQALKKNNNYLKNKVKDQRTLIEAYKTGVRWGKRT